MVFPEHHYDDPEDDSLLYVDDEMNDDEWWGWNGDEYIEWQDFDFEDDCD